MNRPQHRFWNNPPSRDSEIVKRASGLKIDLYRDRDGDVHGEVEIRCGFGCFGDDGEDFDGRRQAEAMAFVRDLMRMFADKPDDGRQAAG